MYTKDLLDKLKNFPDLEIVFVSNRNSNLVEEIEDIEIRNVIEANQYSHNLLPPIQKLVIIGGGSIPYRV
jgi:hypothetical protein